MPAVRVREPVRAFDSLRGELLFDSVSYGPDHPHHVHFHSSGLDGSRVAVEACCHACGAGLWLTFEPGRDGSAPDAVQGRVQAFADGHEPCAGGTNFAPLCPLWRSSVAVEAW